MTLKRHYGWQLVIAASLAAIAAFVYWYLRSSYRGAPSDLDVSPVTFSRDVAPIVFAKCSSCHHPGEAAPFSLLTYEDVRRHSRQIVDVTQKRFMPPWLPTDGHGDFAGSRRLTDQELQTFKQWVDAGSPLGEEAALP